jgi:hypothetical protein
MSRSGVVFVMKAMERAAAGTTTASPPRISPGSEGDHAPEAIRAHGGNPSLWQRVSAAVRHSTGAAPRKAGWGRRLGRAARAD